MMDMKIYRFITRIHNVVIHQRVNVARCVHQLACRDHDTLTEMDGLERAQSHQSHHLSWLGKVTPSFGLNGRQVEVIRDPSVFYQVLLNETSRARKRIVLSSLYLGTSPLEEKLVQCIYKATANESSSCNNDKYKLKVEVLLDYTRGSRGPVNSRTMLMPLIQAFPDQVKVSLYHSPDLRGFWKKWLPERYNEVIGLQHMKIYLFDDTVILTGANLSESYFTNRQDRYVVIRQCQPLADFFHKLIACVSSLSFALTPAGTVQLAPGLKAHPFEGSDNGESYRAEAKSKLENLLDPSQYTESAKMKSSLHRDTPGSKHSSNQIDTWVYPLVQMAPFGIKTDNFVTRKLFQNSAIGSHIKLASGYFNLTDHYMSTILNESVATYNILTASPEANGFFGARGISGAIPDAYTYIAKKFHQLVVSQCQQDRIQMQEYKRDDWTFHGKGLWYYLPHQTLPSLTLIGSPNFGYRSVFRDLEAQVAIVTRNTQLQKQLHLEQYELYSRSSTMTQATFEKTSRQIPLWVTYVTPIIRNFF